MSLSILNSLKINNNNRKQFSFKLQEQGWGWLQWKKEGGTIQFLFFGSFIFGRITWKMEKRKNGPDWLILKLWWNLEKSLITNWLGFGEIETGKKLASQNLRKSPEEEVWILKCFG